MSEETRDQLVMFGERYLFWPLSRMLQNLEVLSRLGYLVFQMTSLNGFKGRSEGVALVRRHGLP